MAEIVTDCMAAQGVALRFFNDRDAAPGVEYAETMEAEPVPQKLDP